MMKPTISFEDFLKCDLRVGTVIEAGPNEKAKKPALVLKIDFGSYGIKTSSAQICQNHSPDHLVGSQVVAVLNFEPKHIAGIKSEVLVLGALSETKGTILLRPSLKADNGSSVA